VSNDHLMNCMIELSDKPIDIPRLLAAVSDPRCGAEVLFVGTTRQWTSVPSSETGSTQPDSSRSATTRETSHLVYECHHELALAELQRLADIARSRWPVQKVAVVHRLGRVDPLEASVAVAVSCPHRAEAFEAGKWLIDALKHTVPIWKQEHFVQSEAEWIHPTTGNCSCPQ
jgi:molybdopterin synthase catalytic subunit